MNKQIQILNILYKEKAEQCVSSFYAFFKEYWDINNEETLIDNWHIKYLCDELQIAGENLAQGNKKLYDIIINIPPGTSKSSIVTVAWGCWMWLIMPNFFGIYSTNTDGLSTELSIKSKKIIESERFKLMFDPYFKEKYGKVLRLEKNTEKSWKNNFNGGRLSTSTGGSIIGNHGHAIVEDDPQSLEMVESKAKRLSSNRYSFQTLSTRKKDKEKTFRIRVMQRLHDQDIVGVELGKGGNIKHICLPAEISEAISPPELINNYVDGLLDPVRLNRKVLAESRNDLGEFQYSGQFQQNPAPPDGGTIKRSWINTCIASDLPSDIIWELFVDSAYTKEKRNDPTGLMICGYSKMAKRLYIKHSKEVWLEAPRLLKYIDVYSQIQGFSHTSRVRIEPKASGLTLKDMINSNNDTDLKATKIISKRLLRADKDGRLSFAAPYIENGSIVFVEGTATEPIINQITRFPRVEHDEFCDLIGYAAYHYLKRNKA